MSESMSILASRPVTGGCRHLVDGIVPTVKNALAARFPSLFRRTANGRVVAELTDGAFVELALNADPGGANDPLVEFHSAISRGRQLEMLQDMLEHEGPAEEWRRHYQSLRKEVVLDQETVRNPQWATIATARPVEFVYEESEEAARTAKKEVLAGLSAQSWTETADGRLVVFGHRAVVAFYKQACPFPCTFCALPGANDGVRDFMRRGGRLDSEVQLEALRRAMDLCDADRRQPVTVEILCDGSWYNDREVPALTRTAMLRDLAARPYVHRVAVETRPEFVSTDALLRDFRELRPDQQLKLYVGLETVDQFIASLVRKLYGWPEFRAAIETLRGLPDHLRRRLSVGAYNMMRQAFMTEREAIESSVETALALNSLRCAMGIDIDVKHEPTIVSKGTLQHYAYHHRNAAGARLYSNMSYFTPAELIVRLDAEGIADRSTFGGRDDIDQVEVTAMVAKPGTDAAYSPLDFIVYDAVHAFNEHRDVARFVVEVSAAVRRTDGRVTEEFHRWEHSVYGTATSMLRQRVFALDANPAAEPEVVTFRRAVAELCARLENDLSLRLYASAEAANDVRRYVESVFRSNEETLGFRFFMIRNVLRIDRTERSPQPDCGAIAYNIEVVIRRGSTPSSVWFLVEGNAPSTAAVETAVDTGVRS
jgi:radical SAM enzyme (TIGR01210 family)